MCANGAAVLVAPSSTCWPRTDVAQCPASSSRTADGSTSCIAAPFTSTSRRGSHLVPVPADHPGMHGAARTMFASLTHSARSGEPRGAERSDVTTALDAEAARQTERDGCALNMPAWPARLNGGRQLLPPRGRHNNAPVSCSASSAGALRIAATFRTAAALCHGHTRLVVELVWRQRDGSSILAILPFPGL